MSAQSTVRSIQALASRVRDPLYLILVLALLATCVAVRQWDPFPVQRARLIAFDTYQAIAPRIYDPASPVKIVDIDEASLSARGQWPWPRSLLAELVDKLQAAGAVAIAFDMVFPEPDRLSPDALAGLMAADSRYAGLKAALANVPSNDEIFAKAIGQFGTVMGFVGVSGQRPGQPPPLAAEIEQKGHEACDFVPYFGSAIGNIAVLSQKVSGSGFINWIADQDQIVRKLPLLVCINDRLYPSIAAEALRLAQGVSNYLVLSSGADGAYSFGTKTGVARLLVGNAVIPTDAQGAMWLHYTRADQRRYVPADAVLRGTVKPDDIKGHIVLIGTSAAGLLDIRATPLDPAIPGVEIHAQAIEQILAGDALARPDFATGAEIFFSLLAGGLMAWNIRRSGAVISFVLGGAAAAAIVATCWLAFLKLGWLLDPVFPAATLSAVYLSGTGFQYLRAERERNRVRHAFGHYMAPALVEKLASTSGSLQLGGQDREITVLFCDVRGFTSRAEGMDAQRLTQFVNGLFTPLADTIVEHQGTIDKFIGDAVMAFWNAPLDDANHAANACRAALSMQAQMEAIGAGLPVSAGAAEREMDTVSVGIGLNTGVCCVGNFGSTKRFDYSAIGNDVNVASRLESLTKDYGVPILAGEATVAAAPGMAFVEIDRVRVKGHERQSRVFALVGDERIKTADWFRRLAADVAAWSAALAEARFDDAEHLLEQLKSCTISADCAFDFAPVWRHFADRLRTARSQ